MSETIDLDYRFSEAITQPNSIVSDSKQFTQSTTPKTSSKLCPISIIVHAVAQLQNCAIFAEQKSNQNILCEAPLSNTQNLRNIESKADSESVANLESNLLDSRSHGYVLDSHHHLFAQKKRGIIPSPHS